MSSRTSFCFSLAAAALSLSAAAPRAHACGAVPPGVSSTIPADGEKYPGNSAVILRGQDISLADASVTVDGQPAKLEQAALGSFFDQPGFFGAFVEPEPAAGQSVVITGTFCEPSFNCPPVTLHYQATAAFEKLLAPIEIVEVDVHDYPEFKSGGGDCQSGSSYAWWLHLKTSIPDQAKEGVLIYEITSSPGFGGEPDFVARGIVTPSWNPVLAVRGSGTDTGGPPLPEAKSFHVSTFSSSGASAESAHAPLGTCHYRVDMGPPSTSPPAEPAWSTADIYPGGPCDSTTSTGSGGVGGGGGGASEDVVIDGCGCRVGGKGDSASGLFGVLALAIGASLRRRRR